VQVSTATFEMGPNAVSDPVVLRDVPGCTSVLSRSASSFPSWSQGPSTRRLHVPTVRSAPGAFLDDAIRVNTFTGTLGDRTDGRKAIGRAGRARRHAVDHPPS
jgi:hypothetical protein